MFKAEITLRASSFTELHKSSNCKTQHKGTGQMLNYAEAGRTPPSTRTPNARISWDQEARGGCS